jgi:hypothetical protein
MMLDELAQDSGGSDALTLVYTILAALAGWGITELRWRQKLRHMKRTKRRERLKDELEKTDTGGVLRAAHDDRRRKDSDHRRD